MAKLHVVILAAGEGKRMQSSTPKVLHKIAGMPMLERVIIEAQKLNPETIHVVYGNGGEQVRKALANYSEINWVLQAQQLGTGHAVMQVLPFLPEDVNVLILYGDVPLITAELLKKLPEQVNRTNVIGVITALLPDPKGFGRIIRAESGSITAIVEEKDCNPYQKTINEINSGIMFIPATDLQMYLPQLQNENAQKEYYLTDLIKFGVANNYVIHGLVAENYEEILGVNDHLQQSNLERYFQLRGAKQLALNGATFMDMQRFDLRGELHVGKEVTFDVNVIIEGQVTIGNNCQIGANVQIRNATIGDNVEILANTIIDGAIIENDCAIGPFARIRPSSTINAKAKVGNFVEIKKSTLGTNTKANHLSYIGDAVIGNDVNVGAGTITCNYDGVNKHQTTIEDGVFVGSDVQFVAPVTIGKNSTIAAGSTITEDVPPETLAIARSRQTIIKNWQRPKK
jgi:bifunctional UDP-N-acetylglucosamine pyrophosphorylase/glucosamine-1-phosphate N-acetyltransferase